MKPKVVIDHEVYRKIMHWVNKSAFEVSGLGTLVVEKDGLLRVTGAMLLPQKNGYTHTDIEADAVCKALYEMRESPGELRFWWHSHVQMGVFWSGTDHQAMRDFASTPGSWMLSTVFNQKRELKSAYYSPDGIESPWGKTPLFYDDLETQVGDIVDDNLPLWDAEYEKNVTNVKHQPVEASGNYYDARTGEWCRTDTEVVKPLSKRQRKKLDKLRREQVEAAQAALEERRTNEEAETAQAYGLDDWGFDPEEKTMLTELGYTDDDIEDLLDRDFNVLQILILAEAGFDYETAIFMLDDMTYTNVDVLRQARSVTDAIDRQERKDNGASADDAPQIEDELPVADRRHGSGDYQ